MIKKKSMLTVILATSIVGSNFSFNEAHAEDYVAPQSYEELVAQGILDPTEVSKTDWNNAIAEDKAAFEEIKNDVAESSVDATSIDFQSSFSPKTGDVLITNNTSAKGFTGHVAMYVGGGEVLEIKGPGYTSKLYSYTDFISRNTKGSAWVKVYRQTKAGWGDKASNYGSDNLKGQTYKINFALNTKGKTYCSKLVWQAYRYGVGASATKIDYNHIVLPYNMKNEIAGLSSKPVKTIY